jgi:3-hydroxybutyryl-CoA dehydrogenase
MLREAMALIESGIATPEQVDLVVKQGLALRLAAEGPLEKADLASLRLVRDVAAYIYPTLSNSESPEILTDMLSAGHEGAKSGQGFYLWTDEKERDVLARRNAEVIRHLQRLRREG